MPTFTSEVDKIAKYLRVKCEKMPTLSGYLANIGNYKRKYDINVLYAEILNTLMRNYKRK